MSRTVERVRHGDDAIRDEEVPMKYVVLIHSNPEPWGHPTIEHTEEGRKLSPERRAEMDRDFEAFLAELSASGEFVTAEALGAPGSSKVYRWVDGKPLVTDGPFTETKEQFAGFFVIDAATPERAHEIALRFASPGDAIELRPTM
jgi:hypothetical protein